MNVKRRSLILICLAISFLISPGFGAARVDFATYSGSNAAVRSLILPGWGQWYNSQDLKAYVLGGLVLCGAGMTYYCYSKANSTYADYEKTGIKNDPLYADYESQINQATSLSLITAGLWVAGVVDAYITADRYVKNNKQTLKTHDRGIFLAQSSSGPRVIYFKRF